MPLPGHTCMHTCAYVCTNNGQPKEITLQPRLYDRHWADRQRHKNVTKQFRFIQFKNQAAVLADLQQCRSLTAYSYESQTHAACSECFRSRNVAKASCIENTHTLTVSCFSRKQIGFTFLVPAHPGSPGKGPLTGVCVCVTTTTTPVSAWCCMTLHSCCSHISLDLNEARNDGVMGCSGISWTMC